VLFDTFAVSSTDEKAGHPGLAGADGDRLYHLNSNSSRVLLRKIPVVARTI
jgi:hypothetical protein